MWKVLLLLGQITGNELVCSPTKTSALGEKVFGFWLFLIKYLLYLGVLLARMTKNLFRALQNIGQFGSAIPLIMALVLSLRQSNGSKDIVHYQSYYYLIPSRIKHLFVLQFL